MTILPGMNARLFPINWRPARDEIDFAAAAGFQAIQFNGIERGIDEQHLGDSLDDVGAILRDAAITPVMEIVVRVHANGRTANGATPLDLLRANMPAISALGCTCVHWHLAPAERMPPEALWALEAAAIPQLAEAVARTADLGVRFGLEHNEPEIPLFATLSSIHTALDAVPGLGFVWDMNHTRPDDLTAYLALSTHMSMVHVSDTPLPDVNHHLPLGMGTVDIRAYVRALRDGGFRGPAILEIGGIPRSGGFGRDTDDALHESLVRLRDAIADSR